jgi:enolase-phosphatase E1
MSIRAILTDIEGTTSSIAFVHEVLFPYAREKLPAFIEQHADELAVTELLDETRSLAAEPDASQQRCTAILLQWIAEDRKAAPLKALQGMIWRQGFTRGDFTAHVYEDAVNKLKHWHASGLPLYIYSSGSVEAQKLFFSHSDAGDLLPLFSGHFDTRTGNKRDPQSYRRISDQLKLPAAEILFLSDVVEELDAAREAGMATIQLVREPGMQTGGHAIARDFNHVAPESVAPPEHQQG